MEIHFDLTDFGVQIDDIDISDMWNIISENLRDREEWFICKISESIISLLEKDFDYYFPYIEGLYNKITELKNRSNSSSRPSR